MLKEGEEIIEKLQLVVPDITHKEQGVAYIKELKEYDSEINGAGQLDRYIDNYEEWLEKLKKDLDRNRIEPGRVMASTFFLVRENDNKIIGVINIRHELNEYLLKKGGHIGYSIRPTERRKGYGSEMLSLGLEKCREIGLEKVLLTCDKSNIGSAKTIQKNLGILENEIAEGELEEVLQRYFINVEEALKRKEKTR